MIKIRKLKKTLAALMAFVMLISALTIPALATTGAQQAAAETLNSLGLFRGVGNDDAGRPMFALNNEATRLQGLIMLVRLLGLYEEAQASNYPNPFEDVQGDYNASIVSFALERGLTTGISANRFDPASRITATQYLTFVLRSLGYESGVDFAWDSAWTLTDSLGITKGEFNAQNNTLNRGDLAVVSLRALFTPSAVGVTLFEFLVTDNVIEVSAIEALSGALDNLADLGVLDAIQLIALEGASEALVEGGYISEELGSALVQTAEEAIPEETPPTDNNQPAPPPPPPTTPPPPPPPQVGRTRAAFITSIPGPTVQIDGVVFSTVLAFGSDGQPLVWEPPANWPHPGSIAILDDPSANITPGFYNVTPDTWGRFEINQLENNVYNSTTLGRVGILTNVPTSSDGVANDLLPIVGTFGTLTDPFVTIAISTTIIDLTNNDATRMSATELRDLVESSSNVMVSVIFEEGANLALSIFVMSAS